MRVVCVDEDEPAAGTAMCHPLEPASMLACMRLSLDSSAPEGVGNSDDDDACSIEIASSPAWCDGKPAGLYHSLCLGCIGHVIDIDILQYSATASHMLRQCRMHPIFALQLFRAKVIDWCQSASNCSCRKCVTEPVAAACRHDTGTSHVQVNVHGVAHYPSAAVGV